MNRRKFFASTGLSAAGLIVSESLFGINSKVETAQASTSALAGRYDIMKEVMKYPKIDAHVHVDLGNSDPAAQKKFAEVLIDYADRLNIRKLVLSKPVTRLIKGIPDGSVEAFIDHNNIILGVMKLHPDRFTGSFTFNPVHLKESMDEIKRCVDQGMVGAKTYYQTKISDPAFYPIVEKMIDLKMIIHTHAETQLGVGGYRMIYDGRKPLNVSIPEDFVAIAKRYPEGMFQHAHIGGGGDWEYMCKALKHSPNVYVDTSGSNNEEWMIDFALQELGEDRLLFGSDNMYYQSVGKILASNLNESQRKKIFFENFNNILRKGGHHVD
ncbi:amidohydrolase family protein [Pedobacter heparinus]|uniref:Amidohydrolase 2 n=1 Tax=Pedobacter heparinus (strain ATCC 13125 / DSM 2366 / CIP 104194 / JCM 7457 / NBRC 12017 / NCIMB 9290 / NRRL B-14731 / HIM 762-3) TaxID=485917 RepID=C6XZ81_PEDHD|nr:amidohydrolase family protein [Pedobacter heparinus]ACU02563.1 amidohydrolase 2 [Pedobacter heparinus DSM 2366]